MPTLPRSLRAWQTDAFVRTLSDELLALDVGALPLQQAASHGGIADADNLAISVFGVSDEPQAIEANIGVFFTEIIAGCSCGDEPTAQHAYCRMRVSIDKQTAQARISVQSD